MRKMMLLTFALAVSSVALLSPAPAKAVGGGGNCVTFCTTPNACGYVCCYQTCCGSRCVDLDCAPPPPCGDN